MDKKSKINQQKTSSKNTEGQGIATPIATYAHTITTLSLHLITDIFYGQHNYRVSETENNAKVNLVNVANRTDLVTAQAISSNDGVAFFFGRAT